MINNVNEETFNFTMCQLRIQKCKPKGRGFTVEDKILALSLYKQSAKGYRLLSRIFSLPSRKTLRYLTNYFLCLVLIHTF